MEKKKTIRVTEDSDQMSTDFSRVWNSCLIDICIHGACLFVVVHEDLFQGRLLDGHIGHLDAADLLQHRVDITLEEEIHRAIFGLQVGHAGQCQRKPGSTLSGDMHLLVVILLQGADIGDFDDLALADDAHPGAQALHLAQDVRGEENGHAAGILLADQVEELALHERVEAGGRLIQEEQLGAVQQALHDADLLLVAVGQVADAAVQLQLHDFRQLVHALGAVAVVKSWQNT